MSVFVSLSYAFTAVLKINWKFEAGDIAVTGQVEDIVLAAGRRVRLDEECDVLSQRAFMRIQALVSVAGKLNKVQMIDAEQA
jgi:hypothetical protein